MILSPVSVLLRAEDGERAVRLCNPFVRQRVNDSSGQLIVGKVLFFVPLVEGGRIAVGHTS